MHRRLSLQSTAGAFVAASLSSVGLATERAKQEKMIGIQIGAVSFADEGVSQVLDECQKSAFVNTLFVATFTHGRGIALGYVSTLTCMEISSPPAERTFHLLFPPDISSVNDNSKHQH